MKYYTVETLAMSIDPNRDYTVKEIEGLYQDYLSNLDGTVEFYRDIDAALARYKEIDQGVMEIGEGDIRDPAGFRGHPTDCDIECLGVIKPENTVKHIHKLLKLYRQRKAGK